MQEDELDEDAENSGKGGCGLGGNLDVTVCRAEWYFHLGAYQAWRSHYTPLYLCSCLVQHFPVDVDDAKDSTTQCSDSVVCVQDCHALSTQLLDQDPYALEAMPVHLAACLELRMKNELFLRAHK